MEQAKNIGAENARWDLSIFYKDPGDPTIDRDLDDLTARQKKFSESYKGKLAEALGQAIADYIEMVMLEEKVFGYLFLKQSLDVTEPRVKAKLADAQRIVSESSGNYMTFFDIELVALDDATLEGWYAKDPIVARHRPWIDHIRIFKPYLLSEPVEAALTKRSPFGAGAWGEFFDEVEADLRIQWKGREKTTTEILDILTNSQDAAERAEALKLINEAFAGPFAKYAAQSLYMTIGSMAVERRERGYTHPMEGRNKSNRIPDEVVEALHQAVTTVGGPLTERYYSFKAKLLGMKTLKWSDRNAPLPFADTTVVPFDDGMKTVLDAYESFSPTLAGIIRDTIAKKRIDAPATKGKRSGAFNSSLVLPGNIPVAFTLLNYLGSTRDVMTLAHELGHGVHGMLAGEAQGVLMEGAPTAYAETASVFGEMTTFNFLKKQMAGKDNPKELLVLLTGKIEDIINTVVRQINFSNFERRLHGMGSDYKTWSEPRKLSVEEIDSIWLATVKEFYGEEGKVFTYENTSHMWTHIHHFYMPFYVYGYACGELLTQSLYAQQERLGDRFEPLYLELLRAGGTKDAVQLLAPFGLDPRDKTFWEAGIRISLEKMIEEAETLAATNKLVVS